MPTYMVWARIVAKRENYYVTFEDANRKRREFQVNSRDYAQFEVGDTGGLSYDERGLYRGFEQGGMPGWWSMPD